MDEAMAKSGDWPNVAVEAGADPAQVMEEYGVEPGGLRTACYEYERRIEQLKAENQMLRDEISDLCMKLYGTSF